MYRFRSARRALLKRCCVLAGAIVVAGCRHDADVIGDAMARPLDLPSIVDVVRLAVDSGRAAPTFHVAPWSAGRETYLQAEAEQAERFVSLRELSVVVGHAGSRDALIGAAIYNAAGVPQIVPTATSQRLRNAGPWTFMLPPSDDAEGAFLASYVLDSLQVARVALLYVGDEYGMGIRDGIVAALERRATHLAGHALVTGLPCGGVDSVAFREIVVSAMRRSMPDVVVLATGQRQATCAIRLIATERPDAWIIGADGVTLSAPEIRALPIAIRQRLRAVSFWTSTRDSVNVVFAHRVQRLLGRPPESADAFGYDALMLAAAAVHEGGSSREGVANWLRSLGREHPPFQGVTGPIDFTQPRRGVMHMLSAVDRIP